MATAENAFDEEVLRRATDLLSHRGPDGSGVWSTVTADGQYKIGFGHRRLSIIDLSDAGAQPMHSMDRLLTVTFNGELYNYIELRQELVALGHCFRSNSDTEVLIEAYRAWGENAVSRFRGMFAFALFDHRNQSVLLARDAFGKKPLFLAEQTGRIVFASEIHALIGFPGVDKALNWAAFDDFLLNHYVPGPATFFSAIRKLPPGCVALWRGGKLSVRRYFTPPFASIEPDISLFAEAVGLFAEKFEEAVRMRMRSDAPFGAFLSGGIDSSAVVASMTRLSGTPVRTFAAGFSEEAYSELRHARAVAEAFRTNHTEVVVTPESFFEQWPRTLLYRGAPVSESSDIPIFMLASEARKTVKMVLTGEGSDELLAGYPKHRAEYVLGYYNALMPEFIHKYAIRPLVEALPYSARRIKTLAMALGERQIVSRMPVWFGGISRDDLTSLLGRSPHLEVDPYPYSAWRGSALRRTQFFDQTSGLPDNLLERGDRMMMAAGIEGRMPFMDVELARLVARFPDRFLIGHPKGKAVLRAAMVNVLPSHILNRKKVGFRVPINEWFRGIFRDGLMDLLGSPRSETRRLCCSATMDQLLASHLSGRKNHEKILWSLANLELFLRAFKPDLGSKSPERFTSADLLSVGAV